MSRLKDTDLARRYQDHRAHSHPAGSRDHEGCLSPPGWAPEMRRFIVVCATVGCPVFGVAQEVTAALNADGIVRILCGRCREWHEDYVDEGAVEMGQG